MDRRTWRTETVLVYHTCCPSVAKALLGDHVAVTAQGGSRGVVQYRDDDRSRHRTLFHAAESMSGRGDDRAWHGTRQLPAANGVMLHTLVTTPGTPPLAASPVASVL